MLQAVSSGELGENEIWEEDGEPSCLAYGSSNCCQLPQGSHAWDVSWEARCWLLFIPPQTPEMKYYIPAFRQLAAMWGRCGEEKGLLQTQAGNFPLRAPLLLLPVGSKTQKKRSGEKGMVSTAGVRDT